MEIAGGLEIVVGLGSKLFDWIVEFAALVGVE
jgi:hypothetical protein